MLQMKLKFCFALLTLLFVHYLLGFTPSGVKVTPAVEKYG